VLGVFGLSQHTSKETIEEIFTKYGRLEKVMMIVDRETGRSKGFGFVYFDSVDSATKAREACNQMMLDGRRIRTDFSATLKPHDPTPGRYFGKNADRRATNGTNDREGSRTPPRRRSPSPRSRSRSRSRGRD